MVHGGITKAGLSKRKVYSCVVCSLVVNDISILCGQCGKWIHSRCAGVKSVTPKLSINFACRKCEGNIGERMEKEEKLCSEVEAVREFTFICKMVCGGCEAAIIV